MERMNDKENAERSAASRKIEEKREKKLQYREAQR